MTLAVLYVVTFAVFLALDYMGLSYLMAIVYLTSPI